MELTPEQSRLVEDHVEVIDLCWRALARSAGKRIDGDEARSDAMVALCRAAANFDAEHDKQASFKTYAGHRVRGALLDSFRRQRRATGFIRSGGESRQVAQFLPMVHSGRDGDEIEVDTPDLSMDIESDIARSEEIAIARMLAVNERERRVVDGLLSDKSMSDIGADLGISVARVHQIRAEFIERSRAGDQYGLRRAPVHGPVIQSVDTAPVREPGAPVQRQPAVKVTQATSPMETVIADLQQRLDAVTDEIRSRQDLQTSLMRAINGLRAVMGHDVERARETYAGTGMTEQSILDALSVKEPLTVAMLQERIKDVTTVGIRCGEMFKSGKLHRRRGSRSGQKGSPYWYATTASAFVGREFE